MSDNRRVLTAKRKNERSRAPNFPTNKNRHDIDRVKQGIKRPNDTPKKNLANERLKKLRTALKDEMNSPKEPNRPIVSAPALNKINKQNRYNNPRKRQQSVFAESIAKKVPKEGTPKETAIKQYETPKEVSFKQLGTPKERFLKLGTPKEAFTTQLRAPRETFVKQYKSTTEIFNKLETSTSRETCTAQLETTTEVFIKQATSQAQNADNIEEMEWSATDDDSSILNASTSTTDCENINKWSLYKNNFFIVVDTNIFLSHLHVVKDIVMMKITGDRDPVVFIPWIVIEELDFIKDGSHKTDLKFKAQEVIKYIESILRTKHPRMMGQTLIEVNEQKNTGPSQDNKIIACCLQVLEKYKNMVLLTGDINLKAKAHLNNIPVCSHTEIKMKILCMLNSSKAETILNKMTTLCSAVIQECAKNAYGTAYNKMPISCSSPKTLQECISIFNKYWFTIFQEMLMKQFKKSIDDLSSFLLKHTIINDDNELGELLRLCVRVCLFLKDIECCKDTIESTIRDLNNIKVS